MVDNLKKLSETRKKKYETSGWILVLWLYDYTYVYIYDYLICFNEDQIQRYKIDDDETSRITKNKTS